MAAGQSAGRGAKTLLLEKKHRPGLKLRITGRGRCNLTNVASLSDFIAHFGANGRFLRQSFARFFTSDLVEFLEGLNVRTVTEPDGRVFPVGDRAQDVVDALVKWIGECGVTLRSQSSVSRLLVDGGKLTGVEISPVFPHSKKLSTGSRSESGACRAKAVIVATGGASYPGTGSTGDGYRLAQSVGHTIVPIRPGLVPLKTAGEVARRLQGVSLREAKVRMWIEGKKRAEVSGEMLFTHFGLSGPMILSLSRQVVDALRSNREVELSIDLEPDLDERQLDLSLLRDFKAHGKQKLRTLLGRRLPGKLIPVCTDSIGISPDKSGHQMTAEERRRLRVWLKDFRLKVTGHRPLAEAMVTAGGVDIKEVDPRTMESRLVRGLYFAGEVLDLDADTGGYNLQAAFSTGWLAGRSATG